MKERNMHRVKAVSVVLTALLLLLIASAVFAQYSPDVLIVDQDVVDGEVIVARATVNGPGWVVVYADEDGEPAEVIGYAPLMNGINANIMVDLDLKKVTDQLYAVLHEDMGFVGTFEYPGDDMPVLVDDEMISHALPGNWQRQHDRWRRVRERRLRQIACRLAGCRSA